MCVWDFLIRKLPVQLDAYDNGLEMHYCFPVKLDEFLDKIHEHVSKRKNESVKVVAKDYL